VRGSDRERIGIEDRDMTTTLITGANRGLGLEFVRQYAAAGWRVFACCRTPDEAAALKALAGPAGGRVSLHALDVADRGQIDRLGAELRGQPIDLLLNNAGVYGPPKMRLGEIDYAKWLEVLEVNTLAPVRMAEVFLDNVAGSEKKVIACVSSEMGSIARNEGGRHYLYRSSKAALNMAVKSLAIDLKGRGIIAVTVSPGWVQTDMGGADAPLRPEESIAGMIRVFARLRPDDSGKFLSYDGSEIPW
jgi:NAD(P)-dependent dehydrogenase (short-subunit alcohol dehydrogenase family)